MPATSEHLDELAGQAKAYAAACAQAGGALLDHVKTTDTVRDMESIRKALGAEQINYYGFSYGTYLGQVYATLHPTGCAGWCSTATSTRAGLVRANLDQDVAFDKNIKVYFAWVAKYDAVYHLGTTGKAVETHYYAKQAKLRTAAGRRRRSAPTSGPTSSCRPATTSSAGRTSARRSRPGSTSGDAGALDDLYDDANPHAGARQRLRDLPRHAVHRRAVAAATGSSGSGTTGGPRRRPFMTWANAWYNAPCLTGAARRPAGAGRRPARCPPILLISETLDAATPYPGSLEVRGVPDARPDRGRRRHHARRLAVRHRLHRRRDRRLPADRRAAGAQGRQGRRPRVPARARAAAGRQPCHDLAAEVPHTPCPHPGEAARRHRGLRAARLTSQPARLAH